MRARAATLILPGAAAAIRITGFGNIVDTSSHIFSKKDTESTQMKMGVGAYRDGVHTVGVSIGIILRLLCVTYY